MRPIIEAEWAVLRRRSSARAMWAASAVIPLLVVLGYRSLMGDGDSGLQFNGQPIDQLISFSGPDAAQFSLRVRNFFIIPLFLFFLSGQTLAGERSTHVLREQLVRPVSRTHLLLSKVAVLWAWSAASILLNLSIALMIATPLLGSDGPWLAIFLGHFATLFTDLGLIVFGMLISAYARSAATVVVFGMISLGTDWGVRLGLSGLGFLGVESANVFGRFMPGTGLNFWSSIEEGWHPGAAACLLVWTGVAALVLQRRVASMDVP
jgi:ABC-type transport system involved in multi-copper enzyme maturation permease subunit